MSEMSASVSGKEGPSDQSNAVGREGMNLDTANRALMLELLASMSPELSFDDTTEHIIRLTREFFGVDRVGFFLADLERGYLLLRVSEEGKSGKIKVPLKGIAGFIAKTGDDTSSTSISLIHIY